MDKLYYILKPYFTQGERFGRLQKTDKGTYVIQEGTNKNIGLTDTQGDYFYIRYNGDTETDTIETFCRGGLKEVKTPIRVVARFGCPVKLMEAERFMDSLVSQCAQTTDISSDQVRIMNEEMGCNPKQVEYLVMVDAFILSQESYSDCVSKDFCKPECC